MGAYSYRNQIFVDLMRIYRINRSKLTIQVVNFNLCVWIISNPVKFSESETQTKVIFKAKRGPQQKWNLKFEGYQISKCHHKRKVGQKVCCWWWCILSWSWPLLNLFSSQRKLQISATESQKGCNLKSQFWRILRAYLPLVQSYNAREKLLGKCEKCFSSQLFKFENIDRK